MKVALLGAGSVGTIIGALIAAGGEDIVLVDSYAEQVDMLNTYGVRITGHLERLLPVKAILPEEMEGKYDLVISTTKQSSLAESLRNVLDYMHDETTVVTLQNGIPEDISKDIVGADRVMGGGIEFGATLKAPGITELTSDESSLGITFGQLDGEITDKTRAIQAVFSHVGQAHITQNLLGVRYSKLTDNSTFSGMSAALGCNCGKILESHQAMKCIAHLGREAAHIIEKLGVYPEEIFGLQPLVENMDFRTEEEMNDVIDNYWVPLYEPFKDMKASMLQDLEKGKQCEINAINGKFVELDKEVGIEVPFMRTVVDVVTKLQDGELKLENAWDNLDYFDFTDSLQNKSFSIST
jgi:2-dehydropantoate 2-reductase